MSEVSLMILATMVPFSILIQGGGKVVKKDELRYEQAGLGVVSTGEGLKWAEGTSASDNPRGCSVCNRQEGRRSSSLTLSAELPLEEESGKEKKTATVRVAIEHCPVCGRIYDVRCSSGNQALAL